MPPTLLTVPTEIRLLILEHVLLADSSRYQISDFHIAASKRDKIRPRRTWQAGTRDPHVIRLEPLRTSLSPFRYREYPDPTPLAHWRAQNARLFTLLRLSRQIAAETVHVLSTRFALLLHFTDSPVTTLELACPPVLGRLGGRGRRKRRQGLDASLAAAARIRRVRVVCDLTHVHRVWPLIKPKRERHWEDVRRFEELVEALTGVRKVELWVMQPPLPKPREPDPWDVESVLRGVMMLAESFRHRGTIELVGSVEEMPAGVLQRARELIARGQWDGTWEMRDP